ncbi:MAG: guanylate kinase [Pseudonocardiales bacterium]|nr:MAG: guanylate kinase [Pseudonocardiales bacterium]
MMATGSAARLTVLSGPSGVGKGTVVAAIRKGYPHIWVSVSCTTRKPRPRERDGIEYRFVTRERFAELVAHGELLEHAEFAGNLYGTPKAPVLEHIAAGTPALLEIELQGARQVRASLPAANLVFLTPPSWAELERRLAGRGTEPADVIAARLARAKVELAAESEFDEVIVNDDVGRAAAQLVGLIEAVCPK